MEEEPEPFYTYESEGVFLGSGRVLQFHWLRNPPKGLLVDTTGEEESTLLALGSRCAKFGRADLEQK
jgi:hypothetical protein